MEKITLSLRNALLKKQIKAYAQKCGLSFGYSLELSSKSDKAGKAKCRN